MYRFRPLELHPKRYDQFAQHQVETGLLPPCQHACKACRHGLSLFVQQLQRMDLMLGFAWSKWIGPVLVTETQLTYLHSPSPAFPTT